MIELLAPVGNKECLIAAVESGADAVYLAGKLFGARAYAANFEDDELSEAIRYAHLRGVYVFVAVNTLIDNSEIPDMIRYLQFLYQVGADAIIVQDLGVADIARKVVPDLPIHASTQMTVHNLEGVHFLTGLGFSRIVLARELSLADIRYICSQTTAEIETFTHGALCISYSGQCLMSGMIGGRSGNRGRCAQPCRLPYTLVDEKDQDVLQHADCGEYLLSPKDLNTIDLVPEFIDAGVTSFKIEGRMKRPEYVAVVVDTYRRAIDAQLRQKVSNITEQDKKDLAQIFNRDFTTAYLKGKPGRTMMSDRRPNNRGVRIGRVITYHAERKMATIKLDEPLFPNDIIEFWVKVGGRVSATINEMLVKGQLVSNVPAGTEVTIAVQAPVRANDRVFKVFDARLMERARGFFSGAAAIRRIPVQVYVKVAMNSPLSIEMYDADGYRGIAETNFIAERALKRPLTHDTIAKQIERLGTTVFELEHLECQIDGEVMVPVSEINDARRRAVDALEEARLARFQRPSLAENKTILSEWIGLNKPKRKSDFNQSGAKVLLTVHVDSLDKVEAALVYGADVILYGGESFQHQAITAEDYHQAVKLVRQYGKKIILNTPRLVKQWQMERLQEEMALFINLKPDAIGVGNLGTWYLARQMTNFLLHGDYPLNMYNNAAIQFAAEHGLGSITLSPELNFMQIEEIAARKNIPLECIVHGHLPLMVSEYCSIGSYLGSLHTGPCKSACLQGRFWLKDRKDERFPIVTDQFCRMHVLNAKELSLIPHIPRFSRLGIDRIRIEGKYYHPTELGRLTKLYREIIDKGEKHPILAQDRVNTVEHQDITRGHYFRGVL